MRAIRTAMRLFLEDDLARGGTPARWCARCRRDRPGAGYIRYDELDLCNDCATAYELVRAGGAAHTAKAFLLLT